MTARVEQVSDRLAGHLLQEIPELGDEPELRREWMASNRGNIAAWLEVVRRGGSAEAVRAPEEAVSVARTYILRGTSLPLLLRVYRVGHAFVFDEWLEMLGEEGHSRALFAELVGQSLQLSFTFIDAMSSQIVEAYARERDSAVRSTDLARSETARAIAAGEPVDVDQASRTFGYELRR